MAVIKATAFAPATVGNVASGFDLIGHTIDGLGDHVTASRVDNKGGSPKVSIEAITGVVSDLPLTPEDNTASKAALSLLHAVGADFDVALEINKGIPMGSGLGGSAASASAAVVAVNALLSKPLPQVELYPHALAGEAIASDESVGDNVGPQLLGGLVLATATRLMPLPVPQGLTALVIHPNLSIETQKARQCLSAPFPLSEVTAQQGALAQLLVGLHQADPDAMAQGLIDHLIEPRRAHLIQGLAEFKALAFAHQALGASISGAGPSVFAWFASKALAEQAQPKLCEAFTQQGVVATAYVSPVAGPKADVVSAESD